jgi:hypothetical protein
MQMFIAILLFLSGLLYWWHYNPLPSDEEMTAHFHEHRTEIEELVKRYRKCDPNLVGKSCEGLPENQALMEKAGVKRIKNVSPVWHPNPYSKEAAKQFLELIQAGKLSNLNAYSTISVELIDEKAPTRIFASVLTGSGFLLIAKELVFIPEAARVEGEYLLHPEHPWCNCRFDKVILKDRVLPSTDTYPPNWMKGESVFRQIDTHWFIRLWAAAV